MALQMEKDWREYLSNIGISDKYVGGYAKSFTEQEVQIHHLQHLTNDELRDIHSFKLHGHILAIRSSVQQQQDTKPSTSNTSTTINSKSQIRYQPPQLQPNMNQGSFRQFMEHWTVYKSLVGLPPNCPNAAAQIYALTCNDHPQIRQTIADHNPDHQTLCEKDYIEMIRRLLTARSTPETYRNKFFNMSQNTEETCQQWLQRLKEVVYDCEFQVSCDQKDGVFHKFEETLIRSKFILGMHNISIKQDLLSKCLELKTLDDVFNHATRMEITSRDMQQSSRAVAGIDVDSPTSDDEEFNRISSYRKSKKGHNLKGPQKQTPTRKDQLCAGCGSSQHGSIDRSTKCPAWKKTCNCCGKRGHFGKVCRAASVTDYTNAVIASAKSDQDQGNEIELTITPTTNCSSTKKGVLVGVYPDTGATLCVAGIYILKKLGLDINCLKPTTRRIMTATGGKINCIGKFESTISLRDRSAELEIYVCDNIQRVYLSKAGCIALGIVHENFPHPPGKDPSPKVTLPSVPVRPKDLPYPATVENIPLLKKYLLEAFSKTAFNDDKDSYFPAMQDVSKAHIHLAPNAKPYCRTTPNQIPYFWREGSKKLIDQFVKRGMIAKSPIGRPTPWCAPMVITAKKSNTTNPKLRMTVDLQHLNSQCIRELHHVESPFRLASQVPRNTFKTLLDAVDGYQAIELDEESQHLTTFITSWGCFYFLRIPAGLLDSGDKYTSRYDQVIQHIPRKVKCVDDTLLFDTSISDAFFHTFDFLQTCASKGIVLNASKFRFCEKEITFAGFNITPNGIKPSESTLRALKEFPTPKSTTDVRSWFGLVQQVAFAHSVSEDLAPLRCLLKDEEGKKHKFTWNEQLQEAFESSKKHIVNSVAKGIETFDPERLTCLQCDWSKNGIGFLLLQKHCGCNQPDPTDTTMQLCCKSGWKIVYAGSRFTNPAESRYSPTEGEALAVAWSLKSSRLFTLGCPNLFVITDHKPLLGIMNGRDLGTIKNPRIRRLKEQTLDFYFTIKYCPGKLHTGVDALSRYPVHHPHEASTEDLLSCICESEVESSVQYAIDSIATVSLIDEDTTSTLPVITPDKVQLACLQDSDYMELHSLVTSGFPLQRAAAPDFARVYWPFDKKGLLSTYGNIVLYQERLVIPKSLRSYILRVLHSAHQGCTGMIARARVSVFWPGIRKDILNHQSNCHTCTEIAPSQAREPLQLTPLPERPFQIVCSDIFMMKGRYYLIVVDRFSGFLHIFYSRSPPNHKFIVSHLRDIFVRYGRPDQLETDNGPQFKSTEFSQFLDTWGIKHRLSSPYYPQSNGRAELGVKTAKRLLRTNANVDGSIDNDKVACAVLQYHNTPLQDGPMSPAQLLFGRALSDFLPVNPKMYRLHPYWTQQIQTNRRNRCHRLKKTASRYNFGTTKLKPLQVGQAIVVQNMVSKRWDRYGTILKVLPHRKYLLRLRDTGNTTSRNRRFLKPAHPMGRVMYPLSGPSVSTKRATNPEHSVPPVLVDNGNTELRSSPIQSSATQLPTTQSSATTDPSVEPLSQPSETVPAQPKLPLALRRLLPHNATGLKEN